MKTGVVNWGVYENLFSSNTSCEFLNKRKLYLKLNKWKPIVNDE